MKWKTEIKLNKEYLQEGEKKERNVTDKKWGTKRRKREMLKRIKRER